MMFMRPHQPGRVTHCCLHPLLFTLCVCCCHGNKPSGSEEIVHEALKPLFTLPATKKHSTSEPYGRKRGSDYAIPYLSSIVSLFPKNTLYKVSMPSINPPYELVQDHVND